MARPLDLTELDTETTALPEARLQARLTRSTARAFAAAVAALLIATLVINRSADALAPDGTASGAALAAGTISLTDDDQGRSLFDLDAMVPGRPIVRCLEVAYEGSILPVDLAVRSDASGPLTRYLEISIDEGTGGSFEDCSEFSAEGEVFDGTLDEMTANGWLPLGSMLNQGDTRSFRVRLEVSDVQEALGASARAEFVWEATPS